jgi:alpha-glucosidase (family GH31 glycosyl hydrolase)
VIEAGASSKGVHLPPGSWVHWWSDTLYPGAADVTVQAPLGSPPLFARAGGLVPMLPPGIDTLVDATAPGVVTLASRATELWARSWASGPASVTTDDGSTIGITDDATGVTVAWAPGTSAHNLTIDVDTRARTGAMGAVKTVESLSGAPLVAMSSAAEVQASTGGAWAIVGGHAYVRIAGSGKARCQ